MKFTRLPFEYVGRYADHYKALGFTLDQAAVLEERDRQLEDYLATPSPAAIRGCSVEMDTIFSSSPVQKVPDYTFTTINFDIVNYSDGNFSGGVYTVPVTGVYVTVVRLRLPDNLPATFSFGAGVHTENVDGPWFLWGYSSDATLGRGTDRSSIQITRIKEFTVGSQLRAYCFIDRGTSTDLMSAAFDVVYFGSRAVS